MFNVPKLQRAFPNRFLCRAAFLSFVLALFLGIGSARVQAQSTNQVTNLVQFTSATYSVGENVGFVVIGVTRFGDYLDTLTVDYATSDGTARGNVDYLPTAGTLDFGPFEFIKFFFVLVYDNFAVDGNRTVNLTLANARGNAAELGDPSRAVLTIIDDENSFNPLAAGQVQFSTLTYTVTHEEYIDRAIWERQTRGAKIAITRSGGSKGRILVDWRTTTNVSSGFSTNIAIPGRDYIAASGTVAFDDFQMSTNVVVTILPALKSFVLSTNFYPNLTNLFDFFPPPAMVGLVLSNPRADPDEDPNLIVPTLGSFSAATLYIEDNTAGFTPERVHYVVKEGHGRLEIPINRSFEIGTGVSVRYTINALDDIGDNRNNVFQLDAGSDYATPFLDYLPPDTDPWRLDTSQQEAMLRWGDTDVDPVSLIIPIVDDNEVEFDEDLLVQLYKRQGESDGVTSFNVRRFIVTILFDDQPAGALDRVFNPDNDPNTSPPYVLSPGANNTVQAIAIQQDGKIVLGGDFSAVNTAPRNRIARMNFNGSLDLGFNPRSGADNFVSAIALQDDGKMLIGGGFTSIDGTLRRSIARLNTNGVLDATFNPGTGADGAVRAIAVESNGKILIGGDFLTFDGTNRNYYARLNSNGSLDSTYNPGKGPNGPVHSIALSAGAVEVDREASGGPAEDRFSVDTGSTSGTIAVNYDFFDVPDTLRVYYESNLIYDSGYVNGSNTVVIPYGPGASTSLEVVLNEGSGLSGTIWVYDLTIQPYVDPRPVIGGSFTAYNDVRRNFIARLNLDGSLDTSFNPGTGADAEVYAVAKQGNKVLMGGNFSSFDLRPRHGIARLNEDGSLDLTYLPGTGFNNPVYTIAVQPNGKALVGGLFTMFNSTRRLGMARLNLNGTLDTTFMDTAYNQFAGLVNQLSPENPKSQANYVKSMAHYRFTNATVITNIVVTNFVTNAFVITNYATSDHVFIGGKFKRVGGGFTRDDIRNRNNIARIIGGATPGPGNVELASPTYSIDEDGSQLYVTLVRTNGSLGSATVNFATSDPPPGPGAGTAGADYIATNRVPTWTSTWDSDRKVSDSLMGPNYATFTTNRHYLNFTDYTFPAKPPLRYINTTVDDIWVPILDDNLIEGDEVVNFRLSNPSGQLFLGGVPIPVGTALGRAEATMIITDNDFIPGTLGFGAPAYTVNENGTTAIITVTRVGGNTGLVTVDYATADGTAIARQDYNTVRGTLTFADGQTTNSFSVPILDDTSAEFEETVKLVLSNPTGFPANIPLEGRLDTNRSTATLTIIDNDFAPGRVSFVNATYTVKENEPLATITVKRTGGNLGELVVNYDTSDGSAKAGTNYTGVSGTLHWVDNDTAIKSFTVPIIDNKNVDLDKIVNLALSNPSIPNALGFQATATLRIINDDAYGGLAFSQEDYYVDENGGFATVSVIRQGGIAGSVSVNYAATNLTAVAGTDFMAVSGTLNFAPGETSKSFVVPIINDSIVEGDKIISLTLSNAVLGTLSTPSVSRLTIIDDELSRVPAGSLDTTFNEAKGTDELIYAAALQQDGNLLIGGDFKTVNEVLRTRMARLNADGSLDTSFDPALGPNNSIRTMLIEPEGRILIAGLFTTVNGTNRNYLARLNFDGNIDPTFNPGGGADNPIYALARQTDGKILIGGDFSAFNGVPRNFIARLNTNGVPDLTFNTGPGASGTIYAIAVQADGKILIGGDFTTFNGLPRRSIVRLNQDGSLDTGFDSGAGPNGSVRAIAVQSDGKVLIGGLFTAIDGAIRNRIGRLNADGSVDPEFNVGVGPASGANGPVGTIAIQIDGRILLGGDFTLVNGVTRNRIARLNTDGSVDSTINFGTGANAAVSSIVLQPDRKIILVGAFTEYDSVPHKHIARVHGGSISGSGSIAFQKPVYTANEIGTNAVITLRRSGGTLGTVAINYATQEIDATPGIDFTNVVGTITFREGETFGSFSIPLVDDSEVEGDERVKLTLSNPAGGAVLGAQPTATLVIVSDDCKIGFSSPNYSVIENTSSQSASVTVVRRGDASGTVTVDFLTAGGSATAGVDYDARQETLVFVPGEVSKTFSITIRDDVLVEGNETVNLILTNLTGKAEFDGNRSTLVVVDNDFGPGELSFSDFAYSVRENGTNAVITVRRRAGSTGVVSVRYATTGGTATPDVDYAFAQGILSFADGEFDKSFTIRIFNDSYIEGNETIDITLSNPTGGATISGPTTVTLAIIETHLGPGSLDVSFNPGVGADGEVRSLQLTPEGKVVVGGAFSSIDAYALPGIARLEANGAVDLSFSAGTRPDGEVSAVWLQSDGKMAIGGSFQNVSSPIVSSLNRGRVARLNADGTIDTTMNLSAGENGEVLALAVQQKDRKIVVAGTFTSPSRGVARLNVNGSLDVSFDPQTAADRVVRTLALQSDDKILIGGDFTSFSGVARGAFARLGRNGLLDIDFATGPRANGSVYAIVVQPDGRILMAGDLKLTGGASLLGIVRLQSNGDLDLSLTPPSVLGPASLTGGLVRAIALQKNGQIFIAGGFTNVAGVARNRVARLNADGSLDTSFDAGLGPDDVVNSMVVQPDGKIVIGGDFDSVSGFPRRKIARLNGDPEVIPIEIMITEVAVDTGGSIRLTFTSQAGNSYALEASEDLGSWLSVGGATATGDTTALYDSSGQGLRQRFYRVRLASP